MSNSLKYGHKNVKKVCGIPHIPEADPGPL